MKVSYDCGCFDRELVVTLPDKYKNVKQHIEDLLDSAYTYWHDAENIQDPLIRCFVLDSCLEEFMIKCLEQEFPDWMTWTSEYYGNDPEELAEKWCTVYNGRR